MENKLIKTKKSSSKKTLELNIITCDSSQKLNDHPKMGTGPCMVDGCGCSEFINSDGTCFNINSNGGTCNHLESDHL